MGSLATASLMVPKFLKAFEQGMPVPPGNKVLVILQLSGGNDGLNTIIPYSNDIYYKLRPGIAVGKDKALRLNDDAGIHPALPAFKSLYDEGNLAIVNNVGYPDPDRSHFRSMDIWHTASSSKDYWHTGWLGRYLDEKCKGCDKPTHALEIDDVLSLALKGEEVKGLALKDPRRLFGTSQQQFFKAIAAQHHQAHHEQPVDYLFKTLSETLSSAEYIFQQSRLKPSTAIYPKTNLGNSFRNIASLIFSDINTTVYYLDHGSFDTHINQPNQQQRLFTQMNEAIAAFVNDLKVNSRFKDVMLVTFSEFGRRVAQNASGGTDHGTANQMMLISGGLKQQGLVNELPDLTNLDNGDLKHTVDFKQVYATLLDKWLGADDSFILKGSFPKLDFI